MAHDSSAIPAFNATASYLMSPRAIDDSDLKSTTGFSEFPRNSRNKVASRTVRPNANTMASPAPINSQSFVNVSKALELSSTKKN
eukprot:CAMPEP_0176381350 /NCGR_PEP_ID=MMETSP0126-20121128/31825_1 /TAXON_ID=141414 ORGANISM="Strombidinopsis acuminatum, Strain SPMC142" /NCGR_SAMPLE_ID=MMETSP0126 /ASSEMBLY_ACC=CAM_ASM_000229 /LENGTH=84 /DNA_ID=CAMNT_0017745149 /DNA_START=78 /DNA_END=332 /DNA_ORIENTATION=+